MNTSTEQDYWRKCTSCKTPIAFGQKYWICSVSTCNRARTDLVFCKVSCFDAHVPVLNHKDAGALEKRAPSLNEWKRAQALESAVQRESAKASPAAVSGGDVKREILVVVSKTKDYVRAKAGMNTSEAVMEVLSDKIRSILDDAIRKAQQDERKTLMDRDFK